MLPVSDTDSPTVTASPPPVRVSVTSIGLPSLTEARPVDTVTSGTTALCISVVSLTVTETALELLPNR